MLVTKMCLLPIQIRSHILGTSMVYEGVLGTAEIIEDLPEKVTIRSETSGIGYLVLADSWYPEWEVSVDGESTALLRANGWMRAVRVPAGEHLVEFSYSSRNVVTGGIISGAAALLILISFLFSTIRKKRTNA